MVNYRGVKAYAVAFAALLSSVSFAQGVGQFTIPGTNSTIKIYGFARLDTMWDIGGRADYEAADWASILTAVPPDNVNVARRPQFYMTARASRFGFESVTPASKKYGNVIVKLEGDFLGTNSNQSESYTNSTVFRLRHAYGSFAGLLVGQTWSTFLDLGAYPDTVDFNGPGTIALVRTPQIRYAYNWTSGAAKGLSIAVAAEYSRGSQFVGNSAGGSTDVKDINGKVIGSFPGSSAAARFQTMPDFHANITYAWKWGHISVRGVTLMYNWNDPAVTPATSLSAFGGGAALSGSFKFFGDTLVYQGVAGNGIGRYVFNGGGATNGLGSLTPGSVQGGALLNAAKTQINLIPFAGYHIGFTHVWPKGFRSSVAWAQTFTINPDPSKGYVNALTGKPDSVPNINTTGTLPVANTHQLFLNTFWSFLPGATAGIEYEYGKWTSFTRRDGADKLIDGSFQTGTQHRITLLFSYNLY